MPSFSFAQAGPSSSSSNTSGNPFARPAAPAADSTATGDTPATKSRPNAPKLRESRAFIIEAYTIWASLQRIVAEYEAQAIAQYGAQGGGAVPPPEQVQYYGRVCSLYRDAIVKQLPLIHNDTDLTAPQKQKSLAHHAAMHALLALVEILYFPRDGRGEGLVAEELLDWVNTTDRAPSAEEGTELVALASPWDSPTFFPYLHRCLLRGHLASAAALLNLVVAQHPAPYLQTVARLVAELVASFPRSTNYRTESAFATALRAWRNSTLPQTRSEIDRTLSEAESDPVLGGPDNEDERASFEQGFTVVLDLLTGSEQTLLDSAADWREALSAFGIWSAPGSLRRADLPAIVERITSDAHPVDTSLPTEVAQLALFKGDVAGVLKTLTGAWAWLGTHIADLLSHLHLPMFDLPPPPPPTTGAEQDDNEVDSLGLREHFLLDWGQRCVGADPGLWRITCEYWTACGRPGKEKARELIKRLEIVAPGEEERDERERRKRTEADSRTDGMDVEGSGAAGAAAAPGKETDAEAEALLATLGGAGRRVDELLIVCASLDLETEFIDICSRYADWLVDRKRYGEAVAYAVRAGDGTKVATIAELIGEEYVVSGQEAFVKHVDSLPTSLLRPSDSAFADSSSRDGLPSLSELPSLTSDALRPHLSRLAFLARYRDFLALYAAGARREAAELLVLLLTSGVAPKKWWAVMLLDAVPLLETTPPLVSLAETFELLRILEELMTPIVVSTPPRDIFGSLELLGRLAESSSTDSTTSQAAPAVKAKKDGSTAVQGEKEKEGERLRRAMSQMEVVRTALARHLATCSCLE